MVFPHRTAIHDDKHDEIYYPEDIHSNRLIDPEGAVWIVETKEKDMEEILERFESGELLDDYNHRLITVSNRFTKLASTGHKDLEGNEVFEGHIFKPKIRYYGQGTIEKWEDGLFLIYWNQSLTGFHYKSDESYRGEVIDYDIKGHALTDPELVPDDFNVDQYFNQYGIDT